MGKSDIPVAVKVINPPKDALEAELFMREIANCACPRHPCLLELLSVSFQPYATVTRLAQTDLSKVLDLEAKSTPRSGWNNTAKSCCIVGIAVGMCYLHEHNIIHRDLKVDNILLDDKFRPWISDFGLSKVMPSGPELQRALEMTQNIGTPLYMAPELAIEGEYGTPVDVYAYGMILYEIFTLKKPFWEKNFQTTFAVQQHIIEGNTPTIPADVPGEMKDLMLQCWNMNPSERPTFRKIVEKMKSDPDAFAISSGTFDPNEFDDYCRDILDQLEKPPRRG
jgi:serine/threonine protein kinase